MPTEGIIELMEPLVNRRSEHARPVFSVPERGEDAVEKLYHFADGRVRLGGLYEGALLFDPRGEQVA